jgi:hypothetical protein
MMAKVMMNIQTSEKSPTLESVQKRFGLTDGEIDRSFGVVPIDPEANLFTVLVDERAASKLGSNENWQSEGPYSNPRIEPFDLPQPEDKRSR